MKRKHIDSNVDTIDLSKNSLLFILPSDIILYIISFISYECIILSQVCKKWKEICDEYMKKQIFINEWKWVFEQVPINSNDSKNQNMTTFNQEQYKILIKIFWSIIISNSYQFKKSDIEIYDVNLKSLRPKVELWIIKNLFGSKNFLCKRNILCLLISVMNSPYDTAILLRMINAKIFSSKNHFVLSEKEASLIRNCISKFSSNYLLRHQSNIHNYYCDYYKAISKLKF